MILKIIGILILLYFGIYEIRSAIKQSLKEYVKDYWNFFDFLLITVYLAFVVNDVFAKSIIARKILTCIILLLIFVKLNFFLRIFDGFSFMVSMMQGVFQDLKYFMAFFLITLV